MAQFIKRGTGWQARIFWRDNQQKRHTKSQAGFKTKVQAKQWAVDAESELSKGVDIAKDISLHDYYDQWVKTYKEPKISDKTLSRYHIVGKEIDKFFHNESIKDITRVQYQKFINKYGSNHAPESVKKTNAIVRACVQSAILDSYIYKDFTQRVTLTADKTRTVQVDYLNIKEIKALLKETASGLDPRYTSRYMIITAIYTGARISEIEALTWNDIDFKKRTISINKSWDWAKNSFKPTKTKSSNRTIPVNPQLLNYLLQLRKNAVSNMVFQNCFGKIPSSTACNAKLRALLQKLKINRKNFHFHSLRHSHVALLLSQGIDIYAISKRLGHSDITTTANTYAYLIDEYQEASNKKIINALNIL